MTLQIKHGDLFGDN